MICNQIHPASQRVNGREFGFCGWNGLRCTQCVRTDPCFHERERQNSRLLHRIARKKIRFCPGMKLTAFFVVFVAIIGSSPVVSGQKTSGECKVCTDLFNTFKGVVKLTNASVAELEKIGGAICSAAPKPVAQACDFVLKDVSKIREAIVSGISSTDFCTDAGFCPKAGADMLVLQEEDDDKQASCKLCNDLYNTFKGVVKLTNASVAELEKIGGAICSAAPKPVAQACDFVLTDVTKIRVAIVDGVNSENFCKTAGFCSNRVIQKTNLRGLH